MATALEIYEDFILAKELQGVSKTTIARYGFSIEKMLMKQEADDISDITTADIRRWLMSRDIKPVSVGIDVKNLRTFFRWVVDEGYRQDDPMDRISTPRVPEPPPRALRRAEIHRLLEAAKQSPRDTAIILVLIDSGIRASELGSLTREDLDLEDLSITVKFGKGGKGRVVYICPTTARALRRYLRTRQDKDQALFLSFRGEIMNRDSLRQLLYRLSDKAGLSNGKKISPHQLRHTFASQYALNGGDVFSLMRLMGHSTPRMASRYVALAGRDIKEIHQRCSPVSRLERQRRG